MAALLTGCAAAGEQKAAEPVTLTLTTYDEEGSAGAALVQHFVDEVKQVDPSITITPQFHMAPQEPDAVTAVSNGSADLVMVASRAFDSGGVTTLQALNTPFLIDSSALANAVATSDHVPDLLAGLDDIGVIGLAIAPEGMRHLFGDKKSPVAVQDLDGATVRSPQSQAVWSMLSAAGATPIFDDTRDYDVAESQFDLLTFNNAAGNVTLFAKYDVIGINEKAAHQLSPAQLDVLRTAAADSTTWAVANVPSDAAMASEFCANGGEIAAATPEQLEEWQAVAQPVVDDLRSVASTADLIDAISTMKAGVEAAPPITGCDVSSEPIVGPRLNGTYTFTATVQAFNDAGLHDQDFINRNAGGYTMTLRNGTLSATQRYSSGPKAGSKDAYTATYTLDGDIVAFRWSAQPQDFTSAEVTVLADGSLEFSDWVEGMPEPKFLLQDQVTLRHWERVT